MSIPGIPDDIVKNIKTSVIYALKTYGLVINKHEEIDFKEVFKFAAEYFIFKYNEGSPDKENLIIFINKFKDPVLDSFLSFADKYCKDMYMWQVMRPCVRMYAEKYLSDIILDIRNGKYDTLSPLGISSVHEGPNKNSNILPK